MKQAQPGRDYRALVARGYDACAQKFNEARAGSDEHLLAGLPERLPPGSRILDLGCGGLPVSRVLANKHSVVGVDISHTQIGLARNAIPNGRFLIADMANVAFRPDTFDAVLSFYAIFHTPRSTHEALFRRICGWLRPGGLLVASLATDDEAGYTERFFDVEMFWSNFGLQRYLEMLSSCGFRIVDQRIISHGYAIDAPAEAHPLVVAERV